MAGVVATNYSEALFALALEEKKLEVFCEDIKSILDVLYANEDLKSIMKHPKVKKEDMLKLGRMTNEYISTLANKKKKIEDIKAEMKLKCLKNKEYIHSIGHWTNYLKFLEKR